MRSSMYDEITCPYCHAESKPFDNFCRNCGTKLSKADKIELPTPEMNFETQRKHVTVLFADIKDSTSKIEHLDPEEASKLLKPVVDVMVNSIYKFNGTIIHTAGDGISAVFGAPQPQEDHALRACLSALSIQDKINASGVNIRVRIGINTGEVLLNVIGDTHHMEYDITGSVVNLAARMEQTAEPGTIQITQMTYDCVAHFVQVDPLDKKNIKGMTNLVDVFVLRDIRNTRSLSEIKYKPLIEPYVDRDYELNKLNEMLLQVKCGNGNAVSIVAGPGLGKSRLIYEFTQLEVTRDCSIYFTGGFSHTSSIPLFPITNLFCNLMDISNINTPKETIKKIELFIKELDAPHALSATLALLNRNILDVEWKKLIPQLKHKYMYEVGIKILLILTEKRPLILIIEDLHFIDLETELFIKDLLKAISNKALFLITTSRPEHKINIVTQLKYPELVLAPIEKKDSLLMMNNLLGTDSQLDNIKSKLLNICRGTPFFIEEIIKSLIKEKIFIGSSGHYKIKPNISIDDIHLPETIIAVLQTQVDKLPAEQKKILQIASVIGERFNYNILSELVSLNQKELNHYLNLLILDKYIFEIAIYPELQFSFNHDLIRNVAYNSLLKAKRRSLHLAILDLLEKSNQNNSQIQYMAHHAFLGEDWEKAFQYCAYVAEDAFLMNELTLSVSLSTKAIIAADNLSAPTRINIEKLVFIHLHICHLFIRLSRFAEQDEHLKKALTLALKNKEPYLECFCYAYYCLHHLGTNHLNKAISYAKKSNQLAKSINTLDALLTSYWSFIHLYTFMNDYKKLKFYVDKLFAIIPHFNYAPSILRVPLAYFSFFYLAWVGANIGDFASIALKSKLMLPLTNIDEPGIPTYFLLSGVGIMNMYQGNFIAADTPLQLALQYTTEVEMVVCIPLSAAALGFNYLHLNQPERGKYYTNLAIKTSKELSYSFNIVFGLPLMAESLFLLKEYAYAKEFTQEALIMTQARHLESLHACLLRIDAEIALNLPEPPLSKLHQSLENALGIMQKHNMRVQIGHLYVALAKLFAYKNDKISSINALQRAKSLYQDLDMTYYFQLCEESIKKQF